MNPLTKEDKEGLPFVLLSRVQYAVSGLKQEWCLCHPKNKEYICNKCQAIDKWFGGIENR